MMKTPMATLFKAKATEAGALHIALCHSKKQKHLDLFSEELE
jgi:hypothetical protein